MREKEREKRDHTYDLIHMYVYKKSDINYYKFYYNLFSNLLRKTKL